MERLPGPAESYAVGQAVPLDMAPTSRGTPLVWGVLRRSRRLIVVAMVLVGAATMYFTFRMTPVYTAAATLRIEERESNLPEIFRPLGSVNELSTEMEVLRSRALAQDAVERLGMALRVLEPHNAGRSELFDDLRVASNATPAEYQLLRGPNDQFILSSLAHPLTTSSVSPGQRTSFGNVSFVLRPDATGYQVIRFEVQPLHQAVDDMLEALSVSQPSRDADLIRVQLEGNHPSELREATNLLVSRFIERRQEARRAEASGSVHFLREQLERVGTQLTAAENDFRQFRERSRVIDPSAEATNEVDRLIQKQSERSTLAAERDALAETLSQLDSAAAHRKPGEPSPYRQLLAFPTLLRNPATSQLLSSLDKVEQDRMQLLIRRTPADPDVGILTNRVTALEDQLKATAVTYLTGLTNQVASLDATLREFGGELGTIPRKQIEFTRLERKAKGLEDIYNLLQTRLKEAEIAEAVVDQSVQVVDTAITATTPSRPRPILNLIGGLAAGLMLGIAGGLAREYFDKSVHTRRDVMFATRLPALGLIPRMKAPAPKVALIATEHLVEDPTPRSRTVTLPRRATYTFLTTRVPEQQPGPEASAPLSARTQHAKRISITDSPDGAAEAYGILQTNLAFSRPGYDIRCVVVTSALPGDGKTTCATNLAVTFAQRGLRTVLIDADMRRGMVATLFEGAREPGLADVLRGSVPLGQALRTVDVENTETKLHYIPSGAPQPAAARLVGTESMKNVLEVLKRDHDRVIIDVPPVNLVTDAALLSVNADAVLLVARAGVTESAALTYAAEQLAHVGAPVVGVVLNDIDLQHEATYEQAYRYVDPANYSAKSSG